MKRKGKHTNPHHNQKPRAEPPEINHRIPTALHEIIRVGTSPADPVGEGRDDVGCYDEEGEVVFPEGGGEDDEEEADGEDLVCGERRVSWVSGESEDRREDRCD